MTGRQNISSGAKWEDIVGYSRAVRIGQVIEVAGTTAVENGKIIGQGDVYQQCICIFKKIEQALIAAGGSLTDVVRTRAYITQIGEWEAYAKAHAEFFGQIKPAATLVGVSALIDPTLLIEIEATAILLPE